MSRGQGVGPYQVITRTVSADFGNMAAGAEASVSFTFANLGLPAVWAANAVAVGSPQAGLPAGLVVKEVFATNTGLTATLLNTTAGAIDPPAQNWNFAIFPASTGL